MTNSTTHYHIFGEISHWQFHNYVQYSWATLCGVWMGIGLGALVQYKNYQWIDCTGTLHKYKGYNKAMHTVHAIGYMYVHTSLLPSSLGAGVPLSLEVGWDAMPTIVNCRKEILEKEETVLPPCSMNITGMTPSNQINHALTTILMPRYQFCSIRQYWSWFPLSHQSLPVMYVHVPWKVI